MENSTSILVVDDDVNICKTLSMILEKKGYSVDTAQTGGNGLEMAKEKDFNLAFLDIKLPDMVGVELLKPLKSIHPDIVLIMVTAFASVDTAVQALNEGASSYITKPMDMERVLARVEEALEKQRLIIENRRLFYEVQLELTERKRAEEALRESEERYRTAIENSNDGVAIIKDDRYVYVNQRLSEMISCESPSELVGRSIETVLHPEDRDWVRSLIIKRQKGGPVPARYECRIMGKDGETVFVEVSATQTTFRGEPVNLAYIRDISDRKVMENQLRQAQKMEAIGTLAGGIAHDFNNILTSVIGYTELALSDKGVSGVLRDNLQGSLSAGLRARDLVKQILTFSRQTEKEWRPVQVRLVLKEALKLLRASIPTTVEMRQDIRSEANVMADPTQIHQLIMNLCTNSAHAMRDHGGVLRVELKEKNLDADIIDKYLGLGPGTYLELAVRDTGHGISRENIEKIFDPYFTTKQKGEGTGLGLAMVQGIVQSCGGIVTVDSDLGKGTDFIIYLPVIQKDRDGIEDRELILPLGSEHILFIDDEPSIAQVGKQMLESLGYQVTTRTSSIEVLELYSNQPDRFDMVITDMTMPYMTGDNLARKLIEIRPDIPIILCTGYSNKISHEIAEALGIRAFVMKPLIMRDLAQTIRKVIDE